MLATAISIALVGFAAWSATAVVRTAFELRTELAPVQIQRQRGNLSRPRTGRPLAHRPSRRAA